MKTTRIALLACLGLSVLVVSLSRWQETATAQITTRRVLSADPNRVANLEEQLVNRLRAVADDQKAFIRFIVKQVQDEKLEARLVVAVERYALRRNRSLPFPYFERAIRFMAEKEGLVVPPVRQFATTRSPRP